MQRIDLTKAPRLARMARTVSRKHTAYVAVYKPGGTWLSGWDDGSRDYYGMIVRVPGGDLKCLSLHCEPDPDRMGDPFKQRLVLPPWPNPDCVAIVRYGTFCGKPSTPTLYFRDEAEIALVLANTVETVTGTQGGAA